VPQLVIGGKLVESRSSIPGAVLYFATGKELSFIIWHLNGETKRKKKPLQAGVIFG
jgi:hypothetical protein